MILISIVWRILLNGDASPLNILIGYLGLSPDWLGNTDLVLFTLMGISIWKNIGYFMVLYIAGVMAIPKVYYEAAQVDGANSIQQFFKITIPQLRRTSVLVVFLGIIWSFQIFDLVYTLTGGGPGNASVTIVYHIFNLNFKQFNTGYAMAIANILFLINALLVIAQKKFIKTDE
jgi:multiple sugar transport system permease protein